MIGFTGTQKGMSTAQINTVRRLLKELDYPKVLIHGDCIGADADAHKLAVAQDYLVEIFPPENPSKRAYCKPAAVLHAPRPYLERNHAIVNKCQILIACPLSAKEYIRSGTWATVRYARRVNKPHLVVNPDGSISHD